MLEKYLELNKTELSLPRLLIDQVVVVLRRDVERVAFLRIELKWKAFTDTALRTFDNNSIVDKKKDTKKLEEAGYLSGVQDDGDLPLENNKHHRVLVCAAHPLGRVALDPEERSQGENQPGSSQDVFT